MLIYGSNMLNSSDAPVVETNEDYGMALELHLNKYSSCSRRFLAWGGGESTKIIAEFAASREACIFLSIEDDAKELADIAQSTPFYRFMEFQHLEVEDFEDIEKDCDYSSYPASMGYRFDLVFIGGKQQMRCALKAESILAPDGRVLLPQGDRPPFESLSSVYDIEEENRHFLVLKAKRKSRDLQPPPTIEKRALFVILQGPKANAEFNVTGPFFESYAARVNADLHAIRADAVVPKAALKTLVLPRARDYDRFAILDADIIIRPHAPNVFAVVPADLLGVMPEGRKLDRKVWCEELRRIYRFDKDLPPDRYFNSGVLVMSREHIGLLEALREGPVFGHPLFEQGFLNAIVHARGIPVYDLPTSLNHILDPGFGLDWRYGAFLHVAGSGKRRFKLKAVWSEEIFEGARYLSQVQFLGRFVRQQRLLEIAAQVEGKEVRVFDADDLVLHMPGAYAVLVDETLLISLSAACKPHAVWGPYVRVRPGRWRVSVLAPDGAELVDPRVQIDLCCDRGKRQLITKMPLDGRQFFADIPPGVTDLETRLSITEGQTQILAIKLELEDELLLDDAQAVLIPEHP